MSLDSPYKGLEPFDDSDVDALLFFGREQEREIVVANLIASRLTVLYGPTGVGKSSILRAGVARGLRELPEEPVVVVFDHWGDDPSADLAVALAEASGEGRNGGLLSSVEDVQRSRDVYVILDQAEEYFVYHADDVGFDSELARLVGEPLRVNVLLSLREDSLARLDRFKPKIPAVYANSLRLDRLDRAAGTAAIVRPVESWNELTGERMTVEPALVDSVLDGVGAGRIEQGGGGLGVVGGNGRPSAVEAPYLQLVMQRMWEVERAKGSETLRAATLAELGGARQVVADHLERAVGRLTSDQRDIAALLFTYMVTTSGTKIAHALPDLAEYAGVTVEEATPVVETLSQHRIVRPDEAGRTEIFHDVLAGEVLSWRRRHAANRALEEERSESQRRHRRLAWLASGALIGLVLMSLLSVYALTQRNEAQEKTALAEVARAEALEAAEVADAQRAVAESEQAKADAAREEAVASADAATAARREAQVQRAQAESASDEAEAQAEIAEQEAVRAEQEAAHAAEEAAHAEEQAQRAEEAEADAEREAAKAREEERAARAAEADAERAAREAKARADAEEALTLLATRPLESLRLALSAAEQEPTELAERVLRTSLVSSRLRNVLPGGGGPVNDASFSSDGRLVLTVAERARIYDARDGSLLRALRDPTRVNAAEFSPDGRTVVTSGVDGKARLWPVTGGGPGVLTAGGPQVLTGHQRAVEHATFSADGRLIATASLDRTAMLWNASTGERLAVFQHEGPVAQVEIDVDGTHVLTVSRVARTGRRIARLFDAGTGAPLRTFDQIGITSAIFAPDGSFVVTTSTDDTCRIWELRASEPTVVLRHTDGDVVSAAFSRDGTRLVTASEGSSTSVWQVGTWEKRVGFIGPLNPATDASFSPDGRFIVVSSRDRNAHIFNIDGLRVAILTGHEDGVSVASFSPTGRSLVTASEDGSARLWDPGTEDSLQIVGATKDGVPMRRVSLSPDGRLAVAAGADDIARILDVTRRRQLRVLRHGAAVNDASFSPDGRRVLTASDDGTARLWRTGGEPVHVLGHGGRVLRAIFSPDGTLVATAGNDRAIRIWRTRDGRLLRVLLGHTGSVLDVAFSPDGTLVASAGDNADRTARIWRVGGKELHVLRHRGPVVRVVFSPSGGLLATASGDEMARLWRVDTGKLRHVLRGHTAFVRNVDFRRDGRVLVTASDDSDARTWSVSTGMTLKVLRGHFSAVQAATFSPDGRWIVTAGPRTAGLWDARTGQFFAPTGLADPFLRGPARGPVATAAFTPDGLRVVTASGDGTVRTYLCTACGSIQSLIRLARARLADLERELSAADRRRYLRG